MRRISVLIVLPSNRNLYFSPMKSVLASSLVGLMFALSACQVTTYTNITDGVRTAITYENSDKERVIAKTTEIRDESTGKWFEAERLDNGTYIFSPRGQRARREYLANENSSSYGY